MPGYSDVLVGLQYGDEGKARIIDMIAPGYQVIARFNGGPNAGHTIEQQGKRVALHLIPSGVFYPEMILYVGSGCVVNLEKLVEELKDLKGLGVDLTGRLHISGQASVIQPHHLVVDSQECRLIGTTGNGIGPAYSDRALRVSGNRYVNIRLEDLVSDTNASLDYIKDNLQETLKRYRSVGFDLNVNMDSLKRALEAVAPYVEHNTLFMTKQVISGNNVLFEGAQSFMLDNVKGTFPYVTSSTTVAGSAYTGGDLPPNHHRKTMGVAKAIMSRVGHGPFVSEFGGKESERYCMEDSGRKHTKDFEAALNPEELLRSEDPFKVGIALRILGNEYGASTGRPRRTGSLDLMQLAYAIRCNGVDELFLNKCDLLTDFSRTFMKGIPVVDGYKLDGRDIDYVPSSTSDHDRISHHVRILPGFDKPIGDVRENKDLPQELLAFLEEIKGFCACHIAGIGVGPSREQFVMLK